MSIRDNVSKIIRKHFLGKAVKELRPFCAKTLENNGKWSDDWVVFEAFTIKQRLRPLLPRAIDAVTYDFEVDNALAVMIINYDTKEKVVIKREDVVKGEK